MSIFDLAENANMGLAAKGSSSWQSVQALMFFSAHKPKALADC
jgi:hypothetical protein